ncbi:MAG: AraC family transcriptional regulator [Clostridiales bacterium]|nr:AraC family transcriptional regulator [Clostridiales bacterium]
MGNVEFLSKNCTYDGDYNGIMRTPQNEFNHGLHYHDFFEFVIYLGNAGVFQIDDGEYLVRRGDLVLIDMFKPHTLLYNQTNTYQRFSISVDLNLCISFSTSHSNLLDVFRQGNHRSPVYHVEEDSLQKYLVLLKEYQNIHLNHGLDILEKALIHQLLAYAYNDCYCGEHLSELENQHLHVISRILDYVTNHLSEEISLADLASEVNYSQYYVCRLFKKATGKTLTGYIQEKRIERATCLLRSYDSVNKVAEHVGFNNYSYFYKTFKRFTGYNSAEYQALYRQ